MPNYYYTDVNGNKRGPLNGEQLQALAAKGVITPHTVLDADGGHQGVAGQIPGLKFAMPPKQDSQPPNHQPTPADDSSQPNTYSVAQVRYRSDTEATPIMELLFDHSFRELRPETVVLWIMKIVYIIGAIGLILGSLIYCGSTMYSTFSFILKSIPENMEEASSAAINADKREAFFSMLGMIAYYAVGCVLGILVLRLACEWLIILIHYQIVWSIEFIRAMIKCMMEIPKLLKILRVFLARKLKP